MNRQKKDLLYFMEPTLCSHDAGVDGPRIAITSCGEPARWPAFRSGPAAPAGPKNTTRFGEKQEILHAPDCSQDNEG